MKIRDYDQVRGLWMTIKGFGIRSIDDSREEVDRFLRRNPTTSVVAVEDGKIVGAILCTALSFVFQRDEGLKQLSMGVMIAAYVLIIAAFYIDLGKMGFSFT